MDKCNHPTPCTKPADTTLGMKAASVTERMCREHAEFWCKGDPWTYIVEA